MQPGFFFYRFWVSQNCTQVSDFETFLKKPTAERYFFSKILKKIEITALKSTKEIIFILTHFTAHTGWGI